jgi:two-component system response regulator NreC
MRLRILIIEDHKIMREGLHSLLEKQSDIESVLEAESALEALKLISEQKPNVIIMDVIMPELNGIEATRRILSKFPSIKIIALSMHSDKRLVIGMLRAGASGYLLKDCAFKELAEAIHTVMEDRTYLTPDIIDVCSPSAIIGHETG